MRLFRSTPDRGCTLRPAGGVVGMGSPPRVKGADGIGERGRGGGGGGRGDRGCVRCGGRRKTIAWNE